LCWTGAKIYAYAVIALRNENMCEEAVATSQVEEAARRLGPRAKDIWDESICGRGER
jgi:hypothetical protein